MTVVYCILLQHILPAAAGVYTKKKMHAVLQIIHCKFAFRVWPVAQSHLPYAFSGMTNDASGDFPTELMAVTYTLTDLLSAS